MDVKMNMKRFAEAIEFAAIAHDGAYRKGTTIPSIAHVVEAGLIAMTMTQDENTIIAAILHDIVEDTAYELNNILYRFGSRVAELVSYESEDKMKEITANESWNTRKEKSLKQLENAPLAAKIICLADKLSNMRLLVKYLQKKGMQCGWRSIRKIKRSRNGIIVVYIKNALNLKIQTHTRNIYNAVIMCLENKTPMFIDIAMIQLKLCMIRLSLMN